MLDWWKLSLFVATSEPHFSQEILENTLPLLYVWPRWANLFFSIASFECDLPNIWWLLPVNRPFLDLEMLCFHSSENGFLLTPRSFAARFSMVSLEGVYDPLRLRVSTVFLMDSEDFDFPICAILWRSLMISSLPIAPERAFQASSSCQRPCSS